MKFEQINPYLRFVRTLRLNTKSAYSPLIPYDARMFYTIDGCSTIQVQNEQYIMKKGCVLIIPPGVEYHLDTPKSHVIYIAVNFDYTHANAHRKIPIPPDSPRYFNKNNVLETLEFDDLERFNAALYLTDMFCVQRRLVEAETEYARKMVLYEFKISSIFTDILADCARTAATRKFAEEDGTAEIIINYIHQNYHTPLTNKDIGAYFGFHPNYISNMIKSCTGLPLHKYLLHVRLENAIKLLETQDRTVSEISKICGFGDVSYFSKYFKKVMGISPMQYKS